MEFSLDSSPPCTWPNRQGIPNSASSERVFSVMKRLFGKTTLRDSAYSDWMAFSMKLAFNGD